MIGVDNPAYTVRRLLFGCAVSTRVRRECSADPLVAGEWRPWDAANLETTDDNLI